MFATFASRKLTLCVTLALAAIGSLLVSGPTLAAEIGFIEDFALSNDRPTALKQLIPGTEDYYYYHCLHFQNTEQWDKVPPILNLWIARYHRTQRVIEIENRQALLTYSKNPEATLDLIRHRLNLEFNHQRERLNQKPNLPTALDPALLTRERLNQIAFSRHSGTVSGFENSALDWLIAMPLSPDQRRHLLSRLTRPDYENLVSLVIADLNYPRTSGFGSLGIHRALLQTQLDECLKRQPSLRNQQAFVETYLARLHPSNDANWRQDQDELAVYLDRLWAYVDTLAPVHNSLKAHVLYQRLLLDRSQGLYDAQRFLTYLKLPRSCSYIEPKYLALEPNRRYPANLQQDFSNVTMLPIVGDDEPLVRSYLMHFFVEAEDYSVYRPYIQENYLKHAFAETKVVNGLGDPEKWYSMLPPAVYQQIKDRIDLDFAYTNKTEFAADDPVGLDLFVKNVDTLIVKVFEINTQNFYREHLAEVGPDINLDGLVANEEHTYTYREPPVRRVGRHFDFPTLNKRGVYVIDFIGNGKASRAVVRKGKLRYLVRTSVAGQVFTVFDELNNPVANSSLWLAGNLYTADKDGTIVTPYSNSPGRQPIVLTSGSFSSLESFGHEAEQYSLLAAMFVDREQLLSLRKARLLIRPQLALNGTPVSLKVLEDIRLSIVSTDLDGVASSKEAADIKLFDDRETVYEFQVPRRLATIRFVLSAKVQNQSQNQKVALATEQNFAVNEIDRTEKTEDLYFVHNGGNYMLDLLGKSGEPKVERPVNISLKLRDYTDPVNLSLQTDARGRITLGPLPGVASVTASDPQGTSHTWPLRQDQHTYPLTLNGEAGQPIQVAYTGTKQAPDRSELSLLELRGNQFLADRFDFLSVRGGLLTINKLPPGDYSLWLKKLDRQIHVRLTEGKRDAGYLLGDYRKLEVDQLKPLSLEPVEVNDKTVKITLENATKFSRVHIFATRFEPAFSAYANLASIVPPEPYVISAPRVGSQFVEGRNIGDEYRYIIDRKFARKFPGNMLERPSLLLNPWAIRNTETGQQVAIEGDTFLQRGRQSSAYGGRSGGGKQAAGGQRDFANLDFLAAGSAVLLNIEPNDDGVIELKREELGSYPELLIVAVDPRNTASRVVSLSEKNVEYLDLRLAKGLDPKQHFTQHQRISVLPAGQSLVIPDITSTRFEAYDSLGRVFSLYSTLTEDPKLAEFGFVRNWQKLKPEEKRELYQKYASHELHFFMYKKDPDFFRQVIRPYLANKKDKQFIDRWLLEQNLQSYVEPWNFEQLNTFERILLAQRIDGERSNVARLVREQYALLPPDTDRFTHLFQTALKGSALETSGVLGVLEAELREEPRKQPAGDMPANMPRAAAPGPMAPGRARREAADEKAKNALKKGQGKGEGKELDANKAAEFLQDDRERLAQVRQLYRKLDKTKEWVESNYYHLPIDQQVAELITASAFWRDYSNHEPKGAFYSGSVAEASRNFPEMLMALALLDLPFQPKEHKTVFKGTEMTLTAGSPLIVFHEEIQQADKVAEQAPILVSQNFYRLGERYKDVNGERVDKFVTEEFLVDTVYGCHIVVTNPTSSRKRVDVLLQIPLGAMPVRNGQNTKSVHLDLEPYHTQTLEYFFYFPAAGKFPHYPVQVAAGGEVLAYAAPFMLNVVNELTNIDKDSWDYISQNGTNEDVLNFLKQQNVLRVQLDRIAWRMQDKEFFQTVTGLLGSRHIYNHTLWSYGVKHNNVPAIRQYLQFADQFVAQCGEWLESPLLSIDPVIRRSYEHMDYRPLVNARIGQLGRQREILNDRFYAQYQRLLKILTYRRQLDSTDLMAVTYYMLLQDRVADALASCSRVNPEQVQTRMQYDYFVSYLNFSKAEPQLAKTVAARYADYPVERWRLAFANIVDQADEITNQELRVADPKDRGQVQTNLAATSAAFDFTVESRKVKVNYQNLKELRVNYYPMDIELLFSRNPFVEHDSRQFANIIPNTTQIVELPANATTFEFPLPAKLATSNVLVELVGSGQTQSQAYYSNALRVQLTENYGQIRVTRESDSAALPKVYVKVYARMKNGSVQFYKDGYTDLRGRFDYTSLSTDELDHVDKFSLLILSDEHGAVVREARPPKR